MASAYYLPRPQHTDSFGNLVIQGRLNFYEAGNPGVRKAVFSDPELTTECANPIPLDASGRTPDEVPVVYYETGNYMITLENYVSGSWVEVWQAPNIEGTPTSSGSSSAGEIVVNTIVDLKSVDVATYTKAFVLGSVGVSTGGGGHYYWSALADMNDDGGWYIQRASGGIGRWIRVAESGLDRLDIRIWGAVSNVGPIDSNYAAASSVSASLNLPVSFPYGNWLFQDDTTITASVIIGKGAKFGFVLALAAYTISFNGKTVVESTESIYLIEQMYVVFGSQSGISFVDVSWGFNQDSSAQLSYASGLPLYVGSSVTIASNWSAVTEIIIGTLGHINAGTYSISCEKLTVNGDPRKVITSTGTVIISRMKEHLAWWFGYGVDAIGDHTTQLSKASSVALANNATLVVTQNITNAWISGTITFECLVRFDDMINLETGSSVSFERIKNKPNFKIFNFYDFTAGAYILEGEIDPVWYGADPYGTAPSNTTALQKCIDSAISSAWVNGQGRKYEITGYILLPATARIKNIHIANVDGYAPLQSSAGTTLRLRDVVAESSSAELYAINLAYPGEGLDIDIQGCTFIGGSYTYASGVLGSIRFIGNKVKDGGTVFKTSENQNCTITGNVFEKVELNAGTFFYGNLLFNGNTLFGNTSDILDVTTEHANTVVRNLSIQDNIIRWTGAAADTVLINPRVIGSGAFQDWQAVRVAENVCISTHTVPTVYPDIGGVNGPWCSATQGSDIVNFDEETTNGITPITYDHSANIRIGPMFVPNGQTWLKQEFISGINGEFWCEQVNGLDSDGVTLSDFGDATFTLRRKNTMQVNGRFYEARATAYALLVSSTAVFNFWVRARAIINWGMRCDIGRASKTL